jgi:hypothetical protein
MGKLKFYFRIIEWEAVAWIFGLVYLLFINPYETQTFTLCPFHNLGIGFCPGCGLGRSISFFYHGDILHSIKTHPLGIIAFVIIFARIIKLSKKTFNNYHKKKEVLYG